MDYQHNNSLKEEIIRLISLKQEGGYWDFKRQWYESSKKCDLLHDIICMANNLQNHDAYIIIGVDEEKDYSIVDVKNDPMRRNTQMIVDFLKDKKFAGGIRPLVHVDHIPLHSGDVDIIVIENSHYTPFYLTDRFEGVRANHIYTRVVDSNTPIDKSADINNVEYLWKKRFHLDETPLKRAKYFLKNRKDWEETFIDGEYSLYYRFAPEYTIKIESDEDRTGYEYFLIGQSKPEPSWKTVHLYYYQTELAWFLGLALDDGACLVAAPKTGMLIKNGNSRYISYTYFELDSINYALHCFLSADREETCWTHLHLSKYMEGILLFHDAREHEKFKEYCLNNQDQFTELKKALGQIEIFCFPGMEEIDMGDYRTEYYDALTLQKMLSIFRESK